jgi:hypothetical protein
VASPVVIQAAMRFKNHAPRSCQRPADERTLRLPGVFEEPN